jgi:hypothetical protein
MMTTDNSGDAWLDSNGIAVTNSCQNDGTAPTLAHMAGTYDDAFATMAQMMDQSGKSPTDAGLTSPGR